MAFSVGGFVLGVINIAIVVLSHAFDVVEERRIGTQYAAPLAYPDGHCPRLGTAA
jgi:hypothetical protein